MDITKRKPWNWFRKEEGEALSKLPARRAGADLYAPLSSFHDEIDRLFDSAFRSFGMPSLFRRDVSWSGFEGGLALKPSLDIAVTEKEYVITVEIPGVEEKDVSVQLSDSTLTVSGEKKKETEEKEKDYYRVERSYGSFQRTLAVPEDADQESIAATFKNGVLTIKLGRKAQPKSKAKKVEIQKG